MHRRIHGKAAARDATFYEWKFLFRPEMLIFARRLFFSIAVYKKEKIINLFVFTLNDNLKLILVEIRIFITLKKYIYLIWIYINSTDSQIEWFTCYNKVKFACCILIFILVIRVTNNYFTRIKNMLTWFVYSIVLLKKKKLKNVTIFFKERKMWFRNDESFNLPLTTTVVFCAATVYARVL